MLLAPGAHQGPGARIGLFVPARVAPGGAGVRVALARDQDAAEARPITRDHL
jgi:hypothetical protein